MTALSLLSVTVLVAPWAVEVDEITMGGSAIDRTGTPSYECHVVDMSKDGRVVVGYGSPIPDSTTHGFIWREGLGVKALPWPKLMQGVFRFSMATAISDDGNVMGGMALWLEPQAKIAKLFKGSALPVTALGKVALEDADIAAINRDGSVMGVTVRSKLGDKLFVWRSGQGMKPLLGRGGKRLFGGIVDISADGQTIAGYNSHGNSATRGFVDAKGKFMAVPQRKGFEECVVRCLSDDGLTVFGEFTKGSLTKSFRWKIGQSAPELLAHDFIVRSQGANGHLLGGWVGNEPAILVDNRSVFLLKDIVKGRMTPEEANSLILVAVTMTSSRVILLVDSSNETTDYRIWFPRKELLGKGRT